MTKKYTAAQMIERLKVLDKEGGSHHFSCDDHWFVWITKEEDSRARYSYQYECCDAEDCVGDYVCCYTLDELIEKSLRYCFDDMDWEYHERD